MLTRVTERGHGEGCDTATPPGKAETQVRRLWDPWKNSSRKSSSPSLSHSDPQLLIIWLEVSTALHTVMLGLLGDPMGRGSQAAKTPQHEQSLNLRAHSDNKASNTRLTN